MILISVRQNKTNAAVIIEGPEGVLISKDDPPIFMQYGMRPNAPVPKNANKIRGWIVHHVDFGIALKEKMDSLNIESHLRFPSAKTKYNSLVGFFKDKLNQ